MIKLRKGTSRIVLIFFNYLVIKFPHPKWGIIKRKKTLGSAIHSAYVNLIHGIASNISEGLIYAVVGKQAKHLAPIYTFGIFNISKYEGSRRPTPDEIEAFYASLSAEADAMLNKCDSHSKAPGNWRKTRKGLRLIDYGADPLTTPWALFIFHHNEELSEATAEHGI